jgi:hypothetical protein
LIALVGLVAYQIPRIRNVETLLPDQAPQASPAMEADN